MITNCKQITEHSRDEQQLAQLETKEAALLDKSLSPPWILSPQQISDLKSQLDNTLDTFSQKAPFTLQRLAELALYAPYDSLPKYIRAINRCLLVSSSQSDFPSDQPWSTTMASAQLHPSITHPLGADTTLSLRSRSHSISSQSSASSSSSHSTTLLSPIPWLLKRSPAPEHQKSEDDPANGPADTSTDSASSVLSPPLGAPAHHPGPSPTGGRIDELESVTTLTVI